MPWLVGDYLIRQGREFKYPWTTCSIEGVHPHRESNSVSVSSSLRTPQALNPYLDFNTHICLFIAWNFQHVYSFYARHLMSFNAEIHSEIIRFQMHQSFATVLSS